MSGMWRITLAALWAVLLFPSTYGFSFSHTVGRQCSPITLQWTGGQAPYYATVIPSYGLPGARIQNISIPASSISTSSSDAIQSFTFRLDQAAGLDYSIVMSDATAFGSGGITPSLESQPSNDTSCIGPMVGFDFYFYLSGGGDGTGTTTGVAQPQCAPLTITWDTSITYPLQLLAIVPGSSAFSIPVPQDAANNSIVWDLAIRQDAQYQLMMANAGLYGTGGSTNLTRVLQGSNECLQADSPGPSNAQATIITSLAPTSAPDPTSTSPPRSSNTSSRRGDGMQGSGMGSQGSDSPNAGAIAGGVVGGLLGLALLLLFLICLRRRKRQRRLEAERNDVTKDPDYSTTSMRQATISRAPSQFQSRSRLSFDILGRPSNAPPSPPLSIDGAGSGPEFGRVDQSGDNVNIESDPFVSPYVGHPQDHRLSTATSVPLTMSNSTSLPMAMAGRDSRELTGHARNTSLDTANSVPFGTPRADAGAGGGPGPGNRQSRKVSGTFTETAPATPTTRQYSLPVPHSLAPARSTDVLHHGSSHRLSSARWGADELTDIQQVNGIGHVPGPREGNGNGNGNGHRDGAETRIYQHQDSDVLELPPSYNQLRARNPDEESL